MSLFKALFGSITKTTSSGGFSGGYSKPDISKFISGSSSEPKTELGRAIKDIVETTEQTKKDIQDIVVDTARDIVGLGPSDRKVANDKKEEADQIISAATAKLERQRSKVEESYTQVKELLNKLLEQKKSLLKTTIRNSQNLTTLFENTDWEEKISPTFKNVNSNFQLPAKNYNASFTGYSNSSNDLINLILKKGADKANLDAANEYLEEAKTYRSEVKYQIEKMKMAITNLDFSKLVINEESRILLLLENKLKELNIDLKHQMDNSTLSQNEFNELTNVYKMVSIVADTLKDKMFHADSRVNQAYINHLKELDSIMSLSTPNTPNSPNFMEYKPLDIKIMQY